MDALAPAPGEIKARAELIHQVGAFREFLVYTDRGRYRVLHCTKSGLWDVFRINEPRAGRLTRNGVTWSRIVAPCRSLAS